jgi:hypothetical protein
MYFLQPVSMLRVCPSGFFTFEMTNIESENCAFVLLRLTVSESRALLYNTFFLVAKLNYA